MTNCIYCGTPFDASKGEGDHIIPARLGEFRNDLRFKGVCRDCNTKIGQSEQVLLQCSPVGFFRDRVVPVSSRSRGKKASHRGAHGAPPPQYTANPDSAPIIARPVEETGYMEAPDQLAIPNEHGITHLVELHPGISPKSLKQKIASLGIKNIPKARLHCNQLRYDDYIKTIKEAYPNSKREPLPTIPAGVHNYPFEIKFRFNDHYFRAIAKIAFHYYLAHSSRSRGNEPCFSEIRNFIVNGGQPDKFFPTNLIYFKDDIPDSFSHSWWMHIIAAAEENNIAIGYVGLFQGPEGNCPTHHVVLGKLPPSQIFIQEKLWAHVYEYDKPVPEKGKVGRARRMSIT